MLELDAAGAVTAVNTFGANGLVSRRTVTAGGSQSVFYQFDERGNTAQRLDANGNVLSSHAADAFGGTLAVPASAGSDDPYAGYGAQWGYYRDAETGLYLCTFRYYDPAEGRWLTPDPAGHSGGVNLYGYCLNNPATRTDPTGMASLDSVTASIKTALGSGSISEAFALLEDAFLKRVVFNRLALLILSNPQFVVRLHEVVMDITPGTGTNHRQCAPAAVRIFNEFERQGAHEAQVLLMAGEGGKQIVTKGGQSFGYHYFVRYGDMVMDSLNLGKPQRWGDWIKQFQTAG